MDLNVGLFDLSVLLKISEAFSKESNLFDFSSTASLRAYCETVTHGPSLTMAMHHAVWVREMYGQVSRKIQYFALTVPTIILVWLLCLGW